ARDLDGVPAGPLRRVERRVGRLQDTAHRGAVPGRFRDAHAQGAGTELGVGLLDFLQTGSYPAHEDLGLRRLGHRQNYQKLVATEPAHHIQGATLLAEHLGDLDEEAVAGSVTQGVVDDLEAVEVDHEDAGMELVAEAAGDFGGETLFEGTAIVETGELVSGGR